MLGNPPWGGRYIRLGAPLLGNPPWGGRYIRLGVSLLVNPSLGRVRYIRLGVPFLKVDFIAKAMQISYGSAIN